MPAAFSRVIKVNFNENEKDTVFRESQQVAGISQSLETFEKFSRMKNIYFVILLLAVPASVVLTQSEGVEETNELVSVD